MHPLRVPIPPMEPITHALRVRSRRLHVRPDFYTSGIDPEVRDLLLQLVLFMDISNYEVRIWELTGYIYRYSRPFPQLLDQVLAIPRLCHQIDHLTVAFNVETLDNLGVRVVDSSRLHQPAKGENLSPEQSKLHQQAIEVMKAYNNVRSQFYGRKEGGFIPSPIRFTGVLRNAAVKVALFCGQHMIEDYVLYFQTLCHERAWAALPYLNHCHGEWCYDVYQNNTDDVRALQAEEERLEEHRKQDELDRRSGKKHSIFKDLQYSIELIKMNYRRTGETNVCMSNLDDTLGFHPKSNICKRCNVKEECQKRISTYILRLTDGLVDIVALRSGSQDVAELQDELDRHGVDLDLFDGLASSAEVRMRSKLRV